MRHILQWKVSISDHLKYFEHRLFTRRNRNPSFYANTVGAKATLSEVTYQKLYDAIWMVVPKIYERRSIWLEQFPVSRAIWHGSRLVQFHTAQFWQNKHIHQRTIRHGYLVAGSTYIAQTRVGDVSTVVGLLEAVARDDKLLPWTRPTSIHRSEVYAR